MRSPGRIGGQSWFGRLRPERTLSGRPVHRRRLHWRESLSVSTLPCCGNGFRSYWPPPPVPALPAGALAAADPRVKQVVVIPIRDEIAEPALYILRRGLKEAMADKADVVVLDLKTPGGAIDVTMEMMEALEKYPGLTIAYVDNEAMSAGAFVSAVTGEIWFAPDGIIGAAAPVTSTGQDVDATMKQKLVSYLKARMRATSEGKGYRGQVISAMIDADLELKIDGQVLKEKGELLSLTATEAMKTYGDPARPLLGSGIAPDIDALLAKRFGAARIRRPPPRGNLVREPGGRAQPDGARAPRARASVSFHRVQDRQLRGIRRRRGLPARPRLPRQLGGGAVGARAGASLRARASSCCFSSCSSSIPPDSSGIVGGALMLGALFWSMSDLWPNEPLTIAWSGDAFEKPAVNLGLGLGDRARASGAALLRYLPRGWIWDRLVVEATIGGSAQEAGSIPGAGAEPRRPGRPPGRGRDDPAAGRAGGGGRQALRGRGRNGHARRGDAGGRARPHRFRAGRRKGRGTPSNP